MRLASIVAVCAALGVLAAATAASAQTEQAFVHCDGFGRPSVAGDGMMTSAATWSALFDSTTGNTDNTQTMTFDRLGASACDTALASPHLEPKYWLRRVNLLRAKAMHLMAAGDNTAALAVLDEAMAAAREPDDVFYRRSEGLAVEMVRAYILARIGRRGEADALAMRLWEQRPFSRGVTLNALMVLAGGPREADRERLILRLHQLDPIKNREPARSPLRNATLPPVSVAVQVLYGALPKAETRETFLTYNKKLKRWSDFQKPLFGLPANEGEKTIWTRGWGSIAMVEELALLQAAEFARSRGRSSFIIFRRSDVRWYQEGQPADTVSILHITSVDAANPTTYFKTRQARLIAADEVFAALAHAYGPAAAREWPK